jgi:predicted transcriptional regulator
MATMTIRLPDEKHHRLRLLANKFIAILQRQARQLIGATS